MLLQLTILSLLVHQWLYYLLILNQVRSLLVLEEQKFPPNHSLLPFICSPVIFFQHFLYTWILLFLLTFMFSQDYIGFAFAPNWDLFYIFVDVSLSYFRHPLPHSHLCLIELDCNIIFSLLLLFNCSVMSDSLLPHELQHSRLPCPSLSPGVCLKSCPLSQ